MKTAGRLVFAISAILVHNVVLTGTGHAGVVHVPGDYPTIQQGVDNAADGDQILVASGTYMENVIVGGRLNLQIQSVSGAASTIVDGGAIGPCFSIQASDGIQIDGFTIQQGTSGLEVTFGSSLITVTNNIIQNNTSGGDGGGAYVVGCDDVIIEDNMLLNNAANFGATLDGGGVFWHDGSGAIRRNWFVDNTAHEGGGLIINISTRTGLEVSWNVFSGNDATFAGGGIYINDGTAPDVFNNTVVANTAVEAGGGIWYDDSSPSIDANIVASNDASEGGGVHAFAPGSPASFTCNDVWGNSSNYGGFIADQTGVAGNISADPQFCDPTLLDYQLRSSSPCTAANSPAACGLIGALDVACVVAVADVSWGVIKSMYNGHSGARPE